MALSKNIQKSYELTKEADFTIGGLQCILLEDKVAGIIGTGLIGKKTVQKIAGLVKKVIISTFKNSLRSYSIGTVLIINLAFTYLITNSFTNSYIPYC